MGSTNRPEYLIPKCRLELCAAVSHALSFSRTDNQHNEHLLDASVVAVAWVSYLTFNII